MTLRATPSSTPWPDGRLPAFTGWLGCDGYALREGRDCTTAPMENLTFTALFDQFRLNAQQVSDGGGFGGFMVAPSDASGPAVACNGADCGLFEYGSGLEVTAFPNSNSAAGPLSVLVGWDDCPLPGPNDPTKCFVRLLDNKTVTARFNGTFALTVAKAGTYAGSYGVIARRRNPLPGVNPEIDCGFNCTSQSTTYPGGTDVVVTVAPLPGPPIPPPAVSWSGCGLVLGPDCFLKIGAANAAVTVTLN